MGTHFPAPCSPSSHSFIRHDLDISSLKQPRQTVNPLDRPPPPTLSFCQSGLPWKTPSSPTHPSAIFFLAALKH